MFVKKDVEKQLKKFGEYLDEVIAELDQITDELAEDLEYAEYHGYKKDAERMSKDGAKLCKYGMALAALGMTVESTLNFIEKAE